MDENNKIVELLREMIRQETKSLKKDLEDLTKLYVQHENLIYNIRTQIIELEKEIEEIKREKLPLGSPITRKEALEKSQEILERAEREREQQIDNHDKSISLPPFDYSEYKIGDKAWHVLWGEMCLEEINLEKLRPYLWVERSHPIRQVWTRSDGKFHSTDIIPAIWPSRLEISLSKQPKYKWKTYGEWALAHKHLPVVIGEHLFAAGREMEEEIIDFNITLSKTEHKTCPCNYTEPCSYNCTCANPMMSGGCLRCAGYGSDEQREKKAKEIAKAIEFCSNT